MSLLRSLFVTALGAASALAQAFIPLNGPVYDGNGGPLLSGQTYHITSTGGSCGLSVPAGQTLTVQAGAIVKVGGCVLISGHLESIGLPNQGIVWTSIEDDSHGGDTNGNGTATSPARGDWDTIEVYGTMNMEHCLLRFGGRANGAALSLRNNPCTVRECTIEHGDAKGIRDALNATIETCHFEELTGYPVEGLDMRRLTTFSANTAANCDGGEYALITLAGGLTSDLTMDPIHSINQTGVFVLNTGSVWSPRVEPGATLTLPAGTVLKLDNTSLTSAGGRIDAQGGAGGPVVVTSLNDDSYGGDTRKDGNTVPAVASDWDGVQLQPGDTSSFTGTIVRYARDPAIRVSGSSASLLGCLVEQNQGDGIRFDSPSNPPPTLVGCIIRDNGGRATLSMEWNEVAAAYGNSTSGNAGGNQFHVAPGFVNASFRIAPENYPGDAIEVANRVTINGGGELILEAGTILKWGSFNHQSGFSVNAGGKLTCNGTARQPVVMTSILDDAYGGDTNGDGNATQPSPGNWERIWMGSGSNLAVCRLENVLLRYGSRSSTTLECYNALAQIRSVRIEHAQFEGAQFGAADLVHNLVIDSAGRDGLLLQNGSYDILHATVTGCAQYGIRRTSLWNGTVRNTISWNNATGNFEAVPAASVWYSNGGFAGQNGNVDVDPQFVSAATGDLALQPTSPCLGAGEFATAQAVVKDHEETSRLQDHGLTGNLQADMGAYERAPYRLAASGSAAIGTTMTFTLQGPGGVGTTFLSLNPTPGFLLAPFGFALVGVPNAPLQPSLLLPGQSATFSLPNDPALVDVTFDVQGLGLQLSSPLTGGFTNVDRNRVRLP